MSTFQKVQKTCLRPGAASLMSPARPRSRLGLSAGREDELKEHDPLRRKYSGDTSLSPLINTRLNFFSSS